MCICISNYIHNIAMYVCMYMVVLCAVNDEL